MKDKIIGVDFEIDLSKVKTSVTEENPRFKDSFWTKYSLPFDIVLDQDLSTKIGNYKSLLANNLKRYHDVTHVFEGKLLTAKLEVLEIKENTIKVQLDSGFEELPNFEKKLSELNLESKTVADIYDHANEIVTKKYPETNYNFPKLITEEYDLQNVAYQYFDGIINNRYRPAGSSNYIFPRNEILNDGMVVANRNIIHPLPYLLHVLQVGFWDAGFILDGDILEDQRIKQRALYSGSNYHNTADQKATDAIIYSGDYDVTSPKAHFLKKFKITAPGKYRIKGSFLMNGLFSFSGPESLVNSGDYSPDNPYVFERILNISVAQAAKGVNISIEYDGQYFADRFDGDGKNIGIGRLQINPIRQNDSSGNAIPFIFNENNVDLKRSVPDVTFGDLVKTIKNWLNYDLIFEGTKVFMNKIQINNDDAISDFRKFEVKNPTRKFTDKESFILKFPDIEGLDSIFFDEKGYQLNATAAKTTTEISINGYPVGLSTFRATRTAKPTQDANLVQLVEYSGLDLFQNNVATNGPGLEGIILAEYLKPWFVNRVSNIGFSWSFIVEKNKIRSLNIRSQIYCYEKKHWIKSLVKNSLSSELYSIEIETETI